MSFGDTVDSAKQNSIFVVKAVYKTFKNSPLSEYKQNKSVGQNYGKRFYPKGTRFLYFTAQIITPAQTKIKDFSLESG